MSYTIQATPASLSSLHGDLIYTVAHPTHTADPVTYPNYKFVGDIYINGTMVTRVKKIPNPDTNIGVFNIGNIVRNYVATNFNPTAATILAQTLTNGEFSVDVVMKFGEEYSYTTYTNLVVDSSRTFFNNYNGRLFGTLTSLSGYSGKPLTTRPLTTPVRDDSKFNLIPFFGTTATTLHFTIGAYDYHDELTDSINYYPVVTTANDLLIFNFSVEALNALVPGFLIDGYHKFYTVLFGEVTDNPAPPLYRFDMRCEPMYDTYTLHFLNKFGGFESKDFAKVSRKTIQIEKKDFGKLPYTIDSSGVVSYRNSNNVYNESRSVYSSQFKERMTLNSDLLTDAEYRWLEELVLSPMVYLEQDGYFFPVVISETNYEPKKVVNDELTNLTISIEFGETNNAQFR